MSASGSSNDGAGCPGCSIANDSMPKVFYFDKRRAPIIDAMQRRLLGGLAPREFLRRHWQKRPLFVRGAFSPDPAVADAGRLLSLAARDNVECRIVERRGRTWHTQHGPFARARPKPRDWTLLVSGMNLESSAADRLLRRFSFVPHARLDDLMVSYAAPGGGVGPHVDSYDVFLLQGHGRRRWRVGRQRDLAVRPGLPLGILARFRPQHECLLGPGDMLYLPPEWAHDGVAVDACITYSIGFRAPSAQELATGFLDLLRDSLALEGRYRDAGLAWSREPARIGRDLRAYAARTLSAVAWDERTIARFLGAFLTEPKRAVTFAPPRSPLSPSAFAARAARAGLRLDSRTQLLYDANHLFVNGDAVEPPAGARVTLRRLANARALGPGEIGAATAGLLYRWYRDGFLHFG